MAAPQLWQLGILIFATIASSKCSILSKNLECPLRGATFGGRLALMDRGGLGYTHLTSLAQTGKVIIFQKPPTHLRARNVFGWGKIWTGSRNCQGSDSSPGQCYSTGNRPCLDTGLPCEPELQHVNLTVTTSAVTPGNSRLIVTWQLIDLSDVTQQQITLHQLDNDNCSFSLDMAPREYVLQTGEREQIFRNLSPNSRYKITYFARTPEKSYTLSKDTRTAETEPTESPSNLTYDVQGNKVTYTWDEPLCGKRNGEIVRYEYAASRESDGLEITGKWKYGRLVFNPLPDGLQFFKVRACSKAGCGPYAEERGG